MSNQKNTPPKRGNSFGFMFFHFTLRIVGLKHARHMAAIVCFYYLIFDWAAVKNAMPYVRHIMPGAGFFRRMKFTYLLFVNQAWILLDRTAFNAGLISFNYTSVGYDTFSELAERKSIGIILLGAHFGNWQLALEGLKKLNCKVNIVVSPETNSAVKKYLKVNSSAGNISYISTDGPGHGGVEIASALCEGEVVCLMGDRAYGADTVKVEFLGESAYFPYSAWVIAAKTQSAVIPFFVCKDKVRGYHVWSDSPIYPQIKSKAMVKETIQPLVSQYVRALEKMIQKYPEQCFLFSDVWKE
ncbi:MAG: lysophospholipid acyltransferase family protein [Lentisphaerota bacterium]